jgi:hypothetical protein
VHYTPHNLLNTVFPHFYLFGELLPPSLLFVPALSPSQFFPSMYILILHFPRFTYLSVYSIPHPYDLIFFLSS